MFLAAVQLTHSDKQTNKNAHTHTHTHTKAHTQKIASDYEETMHAGIPCPVLIIAGHFACMPYTFLKSVPSIHLRDDNIRLVEQALP